MRNTRFIAGYFLGIATIFGCASTGVFPWPYYAPSMPDECYDKGVLLGKLGKDGWDDVALNQCKPDPIPSPLPTSGPIPNRLKCIVSKTDDFYAMKADNLKCHSDLQICLQGSPPSGGSN